MDLRPVKIFSTNDTPRLKYIADLILHEILGLSCEIVTDRRKIGRYPVINYSQEEIKGSFKIGPATLLFETGIRNQEIKISEWKNLPVFFQCSSDSDFPFDVFAASFYMVTRYEEYLDVKQGEYIGFKASGSLAFKHGFLKIPVVDLWIKEMAKALLGKFHTLAFRRNQYKALVTFDIDEPLSFPDRNLLGHISGFLHDLTLNKSKSSHRFGFLTKGEKDSYEVFDYLSGSIEKSSAEARFFFPVGDQSDHDRNPSWKNDKYRNLINAISHKSAIGIHASFKASADLPELAVELKRLRKITGKKIAACRFHLLRILIPRSYPNISKSGIEEDYSMGYPDEPGFRAGIARPFLFYNVFDDEPTGMRIIPFQVMDLTLRDHKELNSSIAQETIKNLIQTTKNVGGLYVSIWHNSMLLDIPECKEWRDVFEFTLQEQVI